MTDNDDNSYALIVGDRAHRIAGALSGTNLPPDRASRALALTRTGREIFTQFPVEYRPRESLFQAVTAAGVYLNRFRPVVPWTFLGSEIKSGRCRFDLVFECERGVLIDEMKLGVGRAGEVAVRSQVDRYLVEGTSKWGSRFIGVRLCAVHEPASCRLFTPASRHSRLLTGTDLAHSLEIR